MKYQKLLTRMGAVGATIATPVVASASVGTDATTTAGVTGTVRLTANLTGTIRLAIFQRETGESPGVTGHLASGAITSGAETVNFGAVTVNPGDGALTGQIPEQDGWAVEASDGAIFLARLQADLFYTGGADAQIVITRGTDELNPGVSAVRGTDFDFRWICGDVDSFTNPTAWLNAGALNFSYGTQNTAGNTTACRTYTNAAGVTNFADVDLALLLADSATQGCYAEDFVFTATISN